MILETDGHLRVDARVCSCEKVKMKEYNKSDGNEV